MTPQKWKTNDKSHEGLKLPHLTRFQLLAEGQGTRQSPAGSFVLQRNCFSLRIQSWGSKHINRSLHSRAQNPQSYIEPLEYGVKKWSKGRKGTSAMPPSFQSGRNSDPTRQYRNPQFTRTLFSGPLGNMRKTWQGMVIFATLIVLMVLWVYTYVKIYWVI